jgi:ribonuclease HI
MVLYPSSSALYLCPNIPDAAIVDWSGAWALNGWVSTKEEPVAHQDLLKYIRSMMELRQLSGQKIEFEHVMAHSTSRGNNAADKLAKQGIKLEMGPEDDWAALTYDKELMVETARGVNINVSSLD